MSISASTLVVALLGAAGALALGLVFRHRPRVGVAVWLLVVALIPVWTGVTLKFYFMPATVVAMVLLVFVKHRLGELRLGLPDYLMAAFMLSCLAPIVTGGATLSTAFVVITSWLFPYLIGRLVAGLVGVRWLYGAVAVVFTVVAVGLIMEMVTGWNPFLAFPDRNPDLFSVWGDLQTRGAVTRSEGAFGHSIAAGSATAMAIPMALGSRFRPWLRCAMAVVMGIGVVLTVSRVSIAGAVIGVVLVLFLLRELAPRIRAGLILMFGVLAAAALPFVLRTLRSAGDEATASAGYRGSLLDLVPGISVLGMSPLARKSPDGKFFFGTFRSIDSQLILTGLQYGWFALILGLLGLLAAVLIVISRRGTAATIAVVAQIPALATVALITQYADFFWFVVGLAVCGQVSETLARRGLEDTAGDLANASAKLSERASPDPRSGSLTAIVSRSGDSSGRGLLGEQ
ncbi:hypothetical protein SAMN04489812_2097 [Microlunatus soli]|uniref:O-antigen ligase like membrane protein n=2 Tax=Microlunatus soli TaxID=630515 RepID=A0A1H1SQC3_9ACTN|nr:hypothetical protein SAMN04489812_2097 [Microlunatus soli]